MKRRILYYFIRDLLVDVRAWMWSLYADYGQSIAIIEAETRAKLRAAKQGGQY